LIQTACDGIKGIIQSFSDGVVKIIQELKDTVKTVFDGICKTLDEAKGVIKQTADGIKEIVESIGDAFSKLAKTVGDAVSEIIDSITKLVKALTDFNKSGGLLGTLIGGGGSNTKSANPFADIDDADASLNLGFNDNVSSGIAMLGATVDSINSSTFAKAGRQAGNIASGATIAQQNIDNDYTVNYGGITVYQQPGEDADTLVDKIQDALGSKYWNGRFAQ